jgi:hypothetical protein
MLNCHNVTYIQLVSMRLTETNKSTLTGNDVRNDLRSDVRNDARNDVRDALPLTDVRGMAKRAQTRPTPATPPFQNTRHPFNGNIGNIGNIGNVGNVVNGGGNVRTSVAVARLPESRSCDEILSADTDDDHVRSNYDDHVETIM